MSSTPSLNLYDSSRLGRWLCRLALDPVVGQRMLADPLLFSQWYAESCDFLRWPSEAQALQTRERDKDRSFEQLAGVLEQLDTAFGRVRDMDTARLLLEGHALHTWTRTHFDEVKAELTRSADAFDHVTERESQALEGNHGLTRIEELARALGLSPLETDLARLALFCTVLPGFSRLAATLVSHRQLEPLFVLSAMLGAPAAQIRAALSPAGVLRASQLLQLTRCGNIDLPALSHSWVRRLLNRDETLLVQLTSPLDLKAGAGLLAKITDEDEELVAKVLSGARRPAGGPSPAPAAAQTLGKSAVGAVGVNILLHGADGLDKREVIARVAARAGLIPFVVECPREHEADLPCLTYVAQRLLADEPDALLVVERPADVLARNLDFLRSLFGLPAESSEIRPFDELLLETNPVPCLWAGDNLSAPCVARFVFHAPLKRAGRAERQAQLTRTLRALKLSRKTTTELLQLEDLSALQLQSAVRAASLSGAAGKPAREAFVLHAVKRSLGALQRKTKPAAKDCVTQYSLKYLNHSGSFGPEQILRALKRSPKGTLCLYGPPGTGKTQFVEHMAQELGVPLIAKRASDLLSKYVGDNERNIAAMFQEAEAEEAMLLLDEGDSFLRDRTSANHNWEVSQVNELLQQMERFPGIFVVATNLFQGLDTAALRRFTFKLEFQALTPEQRWEMFVNEAGLKGKLGDFGRSVREDWQAELAKMSQLAAGDFATVKRQAILLGEALTPEQWVEQLKAECRAKAPAGSDRKIGFTA